MFDQTYELKGQTYHHRHEFKECGGRWNPKTKAWIIVGSLGDDTVWRYRRGGIRVTIHKGDVRDQLLAA